MHMMEVKQFNSVYSINYQQQGAGGKCSFQTSHALSKLLFLISGFFLQGFTIRKTWIFIFLNKALCA